MPDQVRRVRIETEVRGQEAVERANKLVAQFEAGLRRVGEAAVAVFVVKQAFDATVHSITASTRALVQHRGAIDSLVGGYRALRLAISPTLFTAGTIGAGIAVEAALRTALSRARQLERDATTAGLSGRTLGSVQTGTIAGRLLGASLPVDDAEKLAAVARSAALISDPLKRAQLALREFGADGARVLPFLTERTADAVERAQALANVLDNDTAAALARLKSDIEAPIRGVRALADEFRFLGEAASVGTAKAVANAFRLSEAIGSGARAGAAGRFGEGVSGGGLPGSTGALLPFSLNNPAFGDRASIQSELDAAAFLSRRGQTKEGLEAELSRLRSRRNTSIAGFNREGASAAERSLFAQSLLAIEPQLRLTEQRLTSIRIAEIQLAEAVNRATSELERQAKVAEDATQRMMRGAVEIFARSPQSVAGEATEAGRRLSAGEINFPLAGLVNVPLPRRRSPQDVEASLIGAAQGEQGRNAIDAINRQLAAAQRIVELTTGPGGELAAVSQISALRIEAARRVAEITRDTTDLEREEGQAVLDRAVQIAEIQSKQRREAREGGQRVFDALIAGRGGIASLAKGLPLATGRTIFGNLAELTLGGSAGKFSLPGTGTAEAPTLLGRILSGTPFGPKTALDQSATALTGSAVALTQAAGVLAGAGGGRISGIPGLGGLSLPSSIFGGASGSSPFIFSAAGVTGRSLTDAERTLALSGITLPPGVSGVPAFNVGRTSALARGIGVAGLGIGATFGAVNGINQGGIQGGLTAGSSIAGGLGGIIASVPSLAAATGPLAPILLGAALGAGVIASFFGDPKQKFAARQRRQLEDRAATGEIGQDLISDEFGSSLDRDRVGNFRRTSITVHVNAIDVKSFVDHRGDITEAVRVALADGTGNAFMEDMRGRLLPA